MPQPGETWETGDQHSRITRGIVAEVTNTRVTLVALTGARMHVPTSRFEGQWHMVAAPPQTSLHCSRCKEPGILTYSRGTSPDFVCPKHLPVGILATMHTPGAAIPTSQPPRNVIQCPECGSMDPVEDVRLGRLERGEFGWWTCTLCSSRWGLISEPSKNVDNYGRWYADTIMELTETMLESSEINRIECSRSAWEALRQNSKRYDIVVDEKVVPDSGFEIAKFGGIPVHMIASLTDGSVLVRARRAPAGSTVSRRPIQKIGGIGGKSVLPPVPAPPPPPSEPSTVLGGVVSMVKRIMGTTPMIDPEMKGTTDSVSQAATIKLPKVGSVYYQRETGKEVEILRVEENDGQWSVALKGALETTSPCILWLNDFHTEYVKSGLPTNETVPEPHPTIHLEIDEEWFSFESDEYVRIQSVDLRKMTAVVFGGSTGRTRNVPVDDFTNARKFKKVEKKTAFDHLLDDD